MSDEKHLEWGRLLPLAQGRATDVSSSPVRWKSSVVRSSAHIHVQEELYQNYRYLMFLLHENLAWHIKFQEVRVSL